MANPYPYTFYTVWVGKHKKTFKTLNEARSFSGQVANYRILVTEYPYGYRIPINVEIARLEQKYYSKIENADWFGLCKDYSYNATTRMFAYNMATMDIDIISNMNAIEAYKKRDYYNPFVEIGGEKPIARRECETSRNSGYALSKDGKLFTALHPYGFNSIDEAGKAAIRSINKKSIDECVEYAGYIYKIGDYYYYAIPHEGFWDNTGIIPESPMGKKVGWYHTHGGEYSEKDEIFSYDDRYISWKQRIPGYLGTPKGGNTVQKYIPPAIKNPPFINEPPTDSSYNWGILENFEW